MSELDEKLWALISERGREASGLTHEESLHLMSKLHGEKVHGLTVVTNDAAERLAGAVPDGSHSHPPPPKAPKKGKNKRKALK